MSFFQEALAPYLYCFFYREHQLTLGWIESQQSHKIAVLPLHATKASSFKINRIEFFWKPQELITERSHAMTSLKVLHDEILQYAKDCPIKELYELSDSNAEYSLEDLVHVVFDKSYKVNEAAALFFALEQDKYFFKRKDKKYIARTTEEIALITQQQKVLLKKQKFHEQTKHWVEMLESGSWGSQEVSNEQKQWLEQILHILINGKNSVHWSKFASILNLKSVNYGEPDELFLLKLLQQAGCKPSFERLALLRAGVKYEFDPTLDEEAKKLTILTHTKSDSPIKAFTIDGIKTKDYDDAISIIEYDADKLKFAVHIADISTTIDLDSIFFKESFKRVSSVYTVQQNFPMLPTVLSENYFSLCEGETRHVVSFYFEVSNNGIATLQEIKQQQIQIEQNYTYDEADDLIEREDSFWGVLSEALEDVRAIRLSQGALDFPRQEVEIKTQEPIEIQLVDRNTPANRLIEELAILVNQTSGNFCYQNNIPALYRTQLYEVIQEFEEGKLLTPHDVKLESTQFSTHAAAHQALGCNTYVQTTSPIRRFADLLMQLQMVSHLQNQPLPFSEEALMGYIEQIDTRQRAYSQVTREIETYWKLKYLKQQQGQEFQGRIRKNLPYGRVEVFLDEILLAFPHSKIDAPHQQTLTFKIKDVDIDNRTASIICI